MAGVKGKGGAPKGNKNALGNRGGKGAPPIYKPELCKIAAMLCEAGATDAEVAAAFRIDEATLHRWRLNHIEFAQATKMGKQPADDRVERSMYQRITGYWLEVEKVSFVGGKLRRYKVKEWQPPSDTLTIFWLKNRRPEHWRETRFNVNVDLGTLSDDEIRNRIADAERQLAELERTIGAVEGNGPAQAGGTAAAQAGSGSPTRH